MNEKILIVEDNPQNMRLIQMTLEMRGYVLLEAIDGEEGLNTAIRERPDLIIMDIQLPKMNGLDVVRKLRQTSGFEGVPIIAITAYAMKSDEERSIEAGCNAYLPKPINTRELPKIISDMLSNKKAPGRAE
jgi:CheY-like chemotaxis protein